VNLGGGAGRTASSAAGFGAFRDNRPAASRASKRQEEEDDDD
jgi:hypothetical protein